jgi:hypothetical protein
MNIKQDQNEDKGHKDPIEQWKNLYTYWHELRFSKNIETEAFFQTQQSKVKSFIIKYIRDGIEDDFSKKNNLARRHAFSVKEIHQAFKNQYKEEKYSISNFHFHIKGLIKDGYLKEIEKILEGRQYQSYYGRTAITFNFFFNETFTDKMKKQIFGPIINLIREFNQDLGEEVIDKLIEENFELLKDYYYRIRLWYRTNYRTFYNARIDLQAFLDRVPFYAFFQPALYESLQKIGSLINLNEIMTYPKQEVEEEYLKDFQGNNT